MLHTYKYIHKILLNLLIFLLSLDVKKTNTIVLNNLIISGRSTQNESITYKFLDSINP